MKKRYVLLGIVAFLAGTAVGATISRSPATPAPKESNAGATPAEAAPQPSPAAPLAPHAADADSSVTPLEKEYTACLYTLATSGQYSSRDGGLSAMKMMTTCPEYQDWMQECQRRRGNAGDCRVEAAFVAQETLKLAKE